MASNYGASEANLTGYEFASSFDTEKPAYLKNTQRKRTKYFPVTAGLLFPWALFAIVFSVLSLELADHPAISYVVLAAGLLIVILFGCMVVDDKLLPDEDENKGKNWTMTIFTNMAFAWVLAVALGHWNFYANLYPTIQLTRLSKHSSVLATDRGLSHLDAGVVNFTQAAHIGDFVATYSDRGTVYCAAPIVGDSLEGGNGGIIDFWAVGSDCCSPQGGIENFTCAETTGDDKIGTRVPLSLKEGPFYQLALQRAIAERKGDFRAPNPIFLRWGQDAHQTSEELREATSAYVALGVCVFFGFQVAVGFLVLTMTLFAKPR